MVNASKYIRSKEMHQDLGIPMLKDEIKKIKQTEALQLLNNHRIIRRLKRTIQFELTKYILYGDKKTIKKTKWHHWGIIRKKLMVGKP